MTGNTRLAAAFFWLIVSCLCWAANYIIARLMMTQTHLTPSSVTFWRYLAAALIMFCAGMTTLGWRRFFAIRRSDWLPMLGQGAVMSLVSLMLLWCERFNSAMDAAMVDAVIPVMIMLGSVFIGQKIRMLQLIGMMISLSGCLFVIRVVTPAFSASLVGPSDSRFRGKLGAVCFVGTRDCQACAESCLYGLDPAVVHCGCRDLFSAGRADAFPAAELRRMVAPCLDDSLSDDRRILGVESGIRRVGFADTEHFTVSDPGFSGCHGALHAFGVSFRISDTRYFPDYLRCGNGPRNFRPAEKPVRALSASCAFRQEVNPCRNTG